MTDKAVNSGLGDPVGQATYQLSLSMADKIDNDVLVALGTTTLVATDAKIDNFIVCLTPEVEDGTPALPAVTIYTKAEANLETERHAKALSTDIVVSAHYAVGLTNESKVVKATFKK